MKVLYLTNYPSPYRVVFFNQLAKRIDLDVMYESHITSERNKDWVGSIPIEHKYYEVAQTSNGQAVKPNTHLFRRIFDKSYDLVVVGCYNSLCGIASICALRALHRRFVINVDGEYFGSAGAAKKIRDRLIKGASGYLIAGEKTGSLLKRLVGSNRAYPYHFSSLTESELLRNAEKGWTEGDTLLCVGQYADYKGLDVLIDAIAELPEAKLAIVGTSSRSDDLRAYACDKGATNIDIIPFLRKDKLGELYSSCRAFILPSRQECWGLVINEAASFGAPIITTLGAGAAADFLEASSPLLANPGDVASLRNAIKAYFRMTDDEKKAISHNLVARSARYSIERTVDEHIEAFCSVLEDGRGMK